MERPAILAASDLGFGGAGLLERQLGRHAGEGVESAGVEPDALEVGFGELDRGQAARLDARRQLGDRQQEHVLAEAHRAPRPFRARDKGRNTNAMLLPGGRR